MKLETVNTESPFFLEVIEWLNDKNHIRFSSQRFRIHTIDTQRDYCNSLALAGHYYFFGIENGMLVGTITILNRSPHLTAEIGILLSNRMTGQGLGKRLFAFASEYALNELQFKKVRAGCLTANLAMIRIFESCGFIKEAIFEKEEIFEKSRVDVVFYAKHRKD